MLQVYETYLIVGRRWFLVPGSSWLLSGTWCTHAHHPFDSRGGSSWWFCYSRLSRSCNRFSTLKQIQQWNSCSGFYSVSQTELWSVSTIFYDFCFKCVAARDRKRKLQRMRSDRKKLRWLLRLQMHYGKCLVSLLLLTDRILFTDCYYVTVLHSHFMVTVLVRFMIGITIHQEYVFFSILCYKCGRKNFIPSTNNSSVVIYLTIYLYNIYKSRVCPCGLFLCTLI